MIKVMSTKDNSHNTSDEAKVNSDVIHDNFQMNVFTTPPKEDFTFDNLNKDQFETESKEPIALSKSVIKKIKLNSKGDPVEVECSDIDWERFLSVKDDPFKRCKWNDDEIKR